MRYYILQSCAFDIIRILPYTESGFDSRHKARYYLDKTGESYCQIVREDRVSKVMGGY